MASPTPLSYQVAGPVSSKKSRSPLVTVGVDRFSGGARHQGVRRVDAGRAAEEMDRPVGKQTAGTVGMEAVDVLAVAAVDRDGARDGAVGGVEPGNGEHVSRVSPGPGFAEAAGDFA